MLKDIFQDYDEELYDAGSNDVFSDLEGELISKAAAELNDRVFSVLYKVWNDVTVMMPTWGGGEP